MTLEEPQKYRSHQRKTNTKYFTVLYQGAKIKNCLTKQNVALANYGPYANHDDDGNDHVTKQKV